MTHPTDQACRHCGYHIHAPSCPSGQIDETLKRIADAIAQGTTSNTAGANRFLSTLYLTPEDRELAIRLLRGTDD